MLKLILKKAAGIFLILISAISYGQKKHHVASVTLNAATTLTGSCHGASYNPGIMLGLKNNYLSLDAIVQATTKKTTGYKGTYQYMFTPPGGDARLMVFYTFIRQEGAIASQAGFSMYNIGEIISQPGFTCLTTEHYAGFGIASPFLKSFDFIGKIGIGGTNSVITESLSIFNYSLMLNAGIGYTLNFLNKKKVELGKKE